MIRNLILHYDNYPVKRLASLRFFWPRKFATSVAEIRPRDTSRSVNATAKTFPSKAPLGPVVDTCFNGLVKWPVINGYITNIMGIS